MIAEWTAGLSPITVEGGRLSHEEHMLRLGCVNRLGRR
jgi:hypothetical protein